MWFHTFKIFLPLAFHLIFINDCMLLMINQCCIVTYIEFSPPELSISFHSRLYTFYDKIILYSYIQWIFSWFLTSYSFLFCSYHISTYLYSLSIYLYFLSIYLYSLSPFLSPPLCLYYIFIFSLSLFVVIKREGTWGALSDTSF